MVRRITRTGRLACAQERPIKEAFRRSEGPQRERVLLPTQGHYVQEDILKTEELLLQDDMVLEATRMTKWKTTQTW